MRAQLLHLNGPYRGQTIDYPQPRLLLGSAPEADVRYPAGDAVEPRHCELDFVEEGCAFHLRALDGAVFVNHQQIREVILEPTDLVELGPDGPKFRFRIHMEEGAVCKPVRVMLRDARDVMSESGILGFSESMGRDLTHHASWRLKIGFPLFAVALVFLAAYVGGIIGTGRTAREHNKLAREQNELYQRELKRIEGELEVFRKDQAGRASREEVEALRARLVRNTAIVDGMAAQNAALAKVLGTYSRGVCMLHGAFTFEIVAKNKPPERILGRDGSPLELEYIGSGFLVSEQGHVLTNRHVAEPWWHNTVVAPLLRRGMRPRFTRLNAIFPGRAPIAIDPATIRLAPEEVDVAVLVVNVTGVPVLPLADGPLAPYRGGRVVLLGYPTGVKAMLARAEPQLVEEVYQTATNTETLIAELAKRDAISPIITQGALNEIKPRRLVYDAATTSGGSGGPVFGTDGRVIGVNFAITSDFDASNFGVPIEFGLRLLR